MKDLLLLLAKELKLNEISRNGDEVLFSRKGCLPFEEVRPDFYIKFFIDPETGDPCASYCLPIAQQDYSNKYVYPRTEEKVFLFLRYIPFIQLALAEGVYLYCKGEESLLTNPVGLIDCPA